MDLNNISIEKLQCIYCKQMFNIDFGYKNHIDLHCVKFRKKSLDDQKCNTNEHLKINNIRKKFICEFCRKPINYKSKLIEHLTVHTNDRKYVCDICNKSFSRKYTLTNHIKNIHSFNKK